MVKHELRDDYNGAMRAMRSERRDPPLLWSPHASGASAEMVEIERIKALIEVAEGRRNFTLMDAYDAHVSGAKRRADSTKLFQHAFLQFPTDIEIAPESEREMLAQGVAFINRTYGGNAVFHARLDRDEVGRHGVDVFFAPRYQKTTAKGTEDWISLSKFSKELARERFGQRQKTAKDRKTGKFEPVTDKAGKPVMVWNDSGYFQGRALQDAFFEHLRDGMGLKWAVRGARKKTREDDWMTPEQVGAEKDLQRAQERAAEAHREAQEARRQADTLRASLGPLRAAVEALEAWEADKARDAWWEMPPKERVEVQKAKVEAARNEPPEILEPLRRELRQLEAEAGLMLRVTSVDVEAGLIACEGASKKAFTVRVPLEAAEIKRELLDADFLKTNPPP
ncbi:MAG: hypothetical protein HC844_19930, partial [Tabrizicola sp.]|nr:hypothetical protein [Tabrizicola sp.]